MSEQINRRELLGRSAATVAAGSTLGGMGVARVSDAAPLLEAAASPPKQRRMKLGMVTYNVAMDWDLATIIRNCGAIGIASIEFRAAKGHKHGVELTLTKSQRQEVRKRCADGGLVIWGMGSACEYHSPDPAVLAGNIEETQKYVELAHDLGARGVKVRPNRLPDGVSEAKTLEQIGRSMRTCGQAAADLGVEIWCEMHGHGTAEPLRMRKMMDIADHPNVGVVWNSNRGIDDKNGSIKKNFELLRPKIYSVHINELVNGYPYRELFTLLNESGYDRYTMIEAQPLKKGSVEDNVRFMKFYKALWEELSRPA